MKQEISLWYGCEACSNVFPSTHWRPCRRCGSPYIVGPYLSPEAAAEASRDDPLWIDSDRLFVGILTLLVIVFLASVIAQIIIAT